MSDINEPDEGQNEGEGTDNSNSSFDISQLLNTEEGQKALRPHLDREIQRALKTYKDKTVPNLVQENLKETLKGLFPDMKEDVTDPLETLTQKVDSIIEESNRSKAEAFTMNKAQQLGIDSEVALSLMGDSTAETEKRLTTVAELLKKQKESALEDYAKQNGRKVTTSSATPSELDALQQKLTEAEKEGNGPMVSAIQRQIHNLTNNKEA